MIVQLVIENEAVIQVKTVELLDDRCHCEADLVSPALLEALGGLPLVKVSKIYTELFETSIHHSY